MKLPDIKDSGKDLVHAVVKTTFTPETKDWPPKNGKPGYTTTTMGSYITVDGKEYNHYFKDKYFDIAKPGAKLLGMKKEYMGKPYYEWYRDAQDEHSYEAPNAPNPGESDFSAPTPPKEDKPDWDAIAEGKVRHGVAVAYIQSGTILNDIAKEHINAWTQFIITGK